MFFILNSNCLSLVYRNTVNFCILTFYLVNLLDSFTSSRIFKKMFFGFSIMTMILSVIADHFIISPISMSFICFSCLTALAKTSIRMLNWSGERRHSCLCCNLKEKVLYIPLRIMVAVGFLFSGRCSSSNWGRHPLALISESFDHRIDGNFCEMLCCIYWDDHTFFSSICLCGKWHWCLNVGSVLHSWDSVVMYKSFYILLNPVCWFFFFLHLCSKDSDL